MGRGARRAGGDDRGPYAPYRQMQRLDRYDEAAAGLLARDLAYPCYCTPEELDADRKAQEAAHEPPRYVGRCANLTPTSVPPARPRAAAAPSASASAGGKIAFDDLVRGEVEIDTANLGGDFVIVRSDGTPLYHFVVVVDDAAMEMTHIIRGEDHLSNTPKHILLFRALGHEVPSFAHLPLILNPDRTKMSKRKSQTAIADYRAQGYMPEAMVNFLALLGWSTGTEEEILTLDELAGRFDLEHVQKGGAVFDKDRLEWLNGQWIRKLETEDLIERLLPFLEADRDAGRIDRVPTPRSSARSCRSSRSACRRSARSASSSGSCGSGPVTVDPALLVPKRWDAATTRAALRAAREVDRRTGPVTFEADELEPPMRALAERTRLEGRRPVHGHPRRRHRPDRHAAAVRLARRARPRPRPRPARRRHRRPSNAWRTCLMPHHPSPTSTSSLARRLRPRLGDLRRGRHRRALDPTTRVPLAPRRRAGGRPRRDRPRLAQPRRQRERAATSPGPTAARCRPYAVDGNRAVAVGTCTYWTDASRAEVDRIYYNNWLLEFGDDVRSLSAPARRGAGGAGAAASERAGGCRRGGAGPGRKGGPGVGAARTRLAQEDLCVNSVRSFVGVLPGGTLVAGACGGAGPAAQPSPDRVVRVLAS